VKRRLDQIDLQILGIVQPDADRSLAQISWVVKRSKAACFKRLQRLREIGVIRRKVTLLDPGALNVPHTAIVVIKGGAADASSASWIAARLARIAEVMDVFQMVENGDFLLRVVMPNPRSWSRLQAKLRALAGEGAISMHVVECLQSKTALPLDFATIRAVEQP
jgi:Lrp/AsnC family transcriptional regulator